ncbi:2-hydroxymuconate tautomerase family protein [Fictibacillus sp. WQ 8-8]|uniref:2-hydroxymuconate tautomerase family protein n=1 Tax=Fictibacillus sp. WQ 8-8 TaxID=2938788 RepID=UPI000A7E10D4|nr:2-hydroxymuconate tautomerase family protein [Fictibacillus sp. WQ 8-8]MCQ6264608.1 2-hydroxymuconate tautomerase family protein [Fictibacillus sp. WQ 8-8]
MPIIQVQIIKGRSDEQIQNMIASVTESAASTLNVKPEQVRVLVTEVEGKHWAAGGKAKE